jgi:hypothetical protein
LEKLNVKNYSESANYKFMLGELNENGGGRGYGYESGNTEKIKALLARGGSSARTVLSNSG